MDFSYFKKMNYSFSKKQKIHKWEKTLVYYLIGTLCIDTYIYIKEITFNCCQRKNKKKYY